MRRKRWFLGRMTLVLALLALAGGLVMVLWNTTVVTTFNGVHALDYVHALGMLVLCRVLFGGLGGRGSWHRRAQWEKWQAMSQEERDALGRRWNWCRGPRDGNEPA